MCSDGQDYRDASHREQVSILVRFVDTMTEDADNVIRERLLAVLEAKETTGVGLPQLLLDALASAELNFQLLLGQGYERTCAAARRVYKHA